MRGTSVYQYDNGALIKFLNLKDLRGLSTEKMDRYARYIPTHLREFVIQPGSPYRKQNLKNALLHGWVRVAVLLIEDIIHETVTNPKNYRAAWLSFRDNLNGWFRTEIVSRICFRFIGGLELPIGGDIEACLASSAVDHGCIDVLEYMHSLSEITNILQIVVTPGVHFLRNGNKAYKPVCYHPNSVIWLIRHGYLITDAMIHSVAERGRETLLRWMLTRYSHSANCRRLPTYLIKGGMMSMVREIDTVRPLNLNCSHVVCAILGNNIEALQWMYDRVGPNSVIWQGSDLIDDAYSRAITRNPSLLSWLIERNIIITSRALTMAVTYGDIKIVRRVFELRDRAVFGPEDPDMVGVTAGSSLLKNSDVAQWLYDSGFPFGQKAYILAARRGIIPMLEWLRQKGVECNDWADVRKSAVIGGQIEVLDWMATNKLI